MYACTFQPRNFTGWDSEEVKCPDAKKNKKKTRFDRMTAIVKLLPWLCALTYACSVSVLYMS